MTTQTKHTPGPWRADKWAPGWTVSAPDSHYSVCHLQDCNNAEANAALIAQAPDLLRQRDRLREALRNLFHDWATLVGQDLRENNADVQKLWRKTESILAETEAKP